jgi:hypothetical protein
VKLLNRKSANLEFYEVPDEIQKLVDGYSEAELSLASHELLDNEEGGVTL